MQVVVKLGSDKPVISMDKNGKYIWATTNDIKQSSMKGAFSEACARTTTRVRMGVRMGVPLRARMGVRMGARLLRARP